jgi:hypothetical protein
MRIAASILLLVALATASRAASACDIYKHCDGPADAYATLEPVRQQQWQDCLDSWPGHGGCYVGNACGMTYSSSNQTPAGDHLQP